MVRWRHTRATQGSRPSFAAAGFFRRHVAASGGPAGRHTGGDRPSRSATAATCGKNAGGGFCRKAAKEAARFWWRNYVAKGDIMSHQNRNSATGRIIDAPWRRNYSPPRPEAAEIPHSGISSPSGRAFLPQEGDNTGGITRQHEVLAGSAAGIVTFRGRKDGVAAEITAARSSCGN